MTYLALFISGELFYALRDETQIGEGWGYGSTPRVDLDVEQMVKSAEVRRVGFGYRAKLDGSREAWKAIRDYAADRAYMEQNMTGDGDAALGRRLEKQVARIEKALA
jgi:hypothetical protein